MTRIEAIREACEIVGLAYHSVGDYSKANDCFCVDYPGLGKFSNQGGALEFVRQAVLGKLQKDGFRVFRWYDPRSGKLTEAYRDKATKLQVAVRTYEAAQEMLKDAASKLDAEATAAMALCKSEADVDCLIGKLPSAYMRSGTLYRKLLRFRFLEGVGDANAK